MKIQELNEYYRMADLAAIRFSRVFQNLLELIIRNERLFQKYAHVFEAKIAQNLPSLFMIPAHLATAIIEGIVVGPVFKELTQGMVPPGTAQQVVSYLPILIFGGFSLGIGNVYHSVHSYEDPFDPQKRHTNTPQLIKAWFFTLAYVTLLFILTQLTHMQPGNNEGLALLMMCLGTAELVLGYFAIPGWQILIAYWAQFRYRTGKGLCMTALNRHSHACDQYYTYYLQALEQYKHETGVPLTAKINRRIQEAIDYCSSDDIPTPNQPPFKALEEELA
jgi:hypothetical protein